MNYERLDPIDSDFTMNDLVNILDDEQSELFDGLLEYVIHLGRLSKKPVFRIDEYQNYKIWEHQLKGRIGVQHNITDDDGHDIWLKIERLKRTRPPHPKENLSEWVSVSNDPEVRPVIQEKIIKTLPEAEVAELLEKGIVVEKDVYSQLKTDENDFVNYKDVVFRLENNNDLKAQINSYINEQWVLWSEEEKPRRDTIKIYDSIFSLQQKIEAQGEDQPIELTWGIGIGRWNCEDHKIDYPFIEKNVEAEINPKDGALYVRPRNIDPVLSVDQYFALENIGVDTLNRFTKKHFNEMSEDIELSPYINESFEPILRQAASHLSKSGIYWPDINPNKENRKPNNVGDTLEVTDSWVIFARPRSSTTFISDIERFRNQISDTEKVKEIPLPASRLVTELSDEAISGSSKSSFLTGLGGSPDSSGAIHTSQSKKKSDLYFPKPFNEAQVNIIERLEDNFGVTVQGPPGTGKTHTIANIICHYLATGRSVLVTSKGEPALSVLQDQIPKEIRALTISLLTNERQGMKQLEAAIELLAGIVSQTNVRDLKQEVVSHETRIKSLEKNISQIDTEIKEWGFKQLTPIDKKLSGMDSEITAMELAELVIKDSGEHEWLKDKLSPSDNNNPKFSDSDIAQLRESRRKLGVDIAYVNKKLPVLQDMPDAAHIVSIHDDLSTAANITALSNDFHIAPLAVSVDNAVERARNLLPKLKNIQEILSIADKNNWIKKIFHSWLKPQNDGSGDDLFEELFLALKELVETRQVFVKTLVEVNEPGPDKDVVSEALKRLSEDKSAFSIISFGHKDAKSLINSIRVEGEYPSETEEWLLVVDYLVFQDDVKKFITRWNHIGEELELPVLMHTFGDSFREPQSIHDQLVQIEKFVKKDWLFIKSEITELFPHGLKVDLLPYDKKEVDESIKAIELNTSRVSLGAQRSKLQNLVNTLTNSDGEISKEICNFLSETIGNPKCSSDEVMQIWLDFTSEIDRLHKVSSYMRDVSVITQKIEDSGAPLWAESLRRQPLTSSNDNLTPTNWSESWQWKRKTEYLKEIDGRDRLKELANRRRQLDDDLRRTFTELVRVKTNIGLHLSMTERVQGALMRFVAAISKIGKGTGKRAPRYRKDAFRAMQDCYGGVPCWIMPTWRISESLPSDYGSFDLVIIDEASQSDITALPAILRAKKLLIVGDDKQVSPTAAFIAEDKILQLKHNFLRGQPFAELLLPGVSVYDLANAIFPGQRIMLTEHFRCVEPIIRFSMKFYNEQLIPLRLPTASEKLNPPLIDVYVKDAKRDDVKRINETEALAILAEIKSIVNDPKFFSRSIGVVSLIGAHQAHYIQELLLSELGEDVYQEFKITCGDAATFQGKERDIMFLSMVVGSGQGAPLTKREYEQRMNVALSRARDRMYLYRSLDENDLTNESDLRLKILNHFKNPMPQQQQFENPIELCDSGFERDVYRKLIEKGYNVFPQVKVGPYSIDLVVEGKNDRRLAVELDGDKYHPPEQWVDDWKRQRTMERVGWKFWRCWGSSYTIDPDGCIDDLVSNLNNMGIEPCPDCDNSNIYTEYREISIEDLIDNEVEEKVENQNTQMDIF